MTDPDKTFCAMLSVWILLTIIILVFRAPFLTILFDSIFFSSFIALAGTSIFSWIMGTRKATNEIRKKKLLRLEDKVAVGIIAVFTIIMIIDSLIHGGLVLTHPVLETLLAIFGAFFIAGLVSEPVANFYERLKNRNK